MRRIWQPMHNIHAPRLTVPLDTLTVTYGRTSSVQPISNAYKNWIATLSSETCMTIATAKLPGLIITSVISPHATLTAIAFWYLIIMIHCQFCRMYILLYSCLSLIASAWPTFWMHCNKRMVMTSALKMAFSLCLMASAWPTLDERNVLHWVGTKGNASNNKQMKELICSKPLTFDVWGKIIDSCLSCFILPTWRRRHCQALCHYFPFGRHSDSMICHYY